MCKIPTFFLLVFTQMQLFLSVHAGLLKAVLGLCIHGVAVYGLWYLLTEEAMSLVCYMEPSLAGYPVVRDCENFPIHPKSFKRNVQFIPWFVYLDQVCMKCKHL